MKKEYSISELEKLTVFSRRTVHFYIKEGLIPPPGSVGTGAKYGEEHFLRLKMIGILQKRDMKLSGIKKILESMSLIEMNEVVSKDDEKSTSQGLANFVSSAYSYAHSIRDMQLLGEAEAFQDGIIQKKESTGLPTGGFLKNKTVLSVSEPEAEKYSPVSSEEKSSLSSEKESKPHSMEIWRHIELIDGIKMNIREDIYHRYKSVLEELINKFK